MQASNNSRRGFLKSMALASAAAGAASASRVDSAAAAEAGPAVAQPPRDRAELGTDFPAEHFKIRRTPIAWPNKARIAVCWIVNYEGYSDTSNSYDIAYKDYSSKSAVWRLAIAVICSACSPSARLNQRISLRPQLIAS